MVAKRKTCKKIVRKTKGKWAFDKYYLLKRGVSKPNAQSMAKRERSMNEKARVLKSKHGEYEVWSTR